MVQQGCVQEQWQAHTCTHTHKQPHSTMPAAVNGVAAKSPRQLILRTPLKPAQKLRRLTRAVR